MERAQAEQGGEERQRLPIYYTRVTCSVEDSIGMHGFRGDVMSIPKCGGRCAALGFSPF